MACEGDYSHFCHDRGAVFVSRGMHIDLAREKTVQGGRKHRGLLASGSGARNVQQQQKRNNTVLFSFLLHVRRSLVLLQVPIGLMCHTMQEKTVVLFSRFCFECSVFLLFSAFIPVLSRIFTSFCSFCRSYSFAAFGLGR